jgi:hypothetical protein
VRATASACGVGVDGPKAPRYFDQSTFGPWHTPPAGHPGAGRRPQPMTIRAGIYCRISRDTEGNQLDVERQEKDCRRIAKERGWEVIEPLYIDKT